MISKGKYILGTPKEVAETIVDESFDFSGATYRLKPCGFISYDFATFDAENIDASAEQLEQSVEYWYGVKKIDTGFDNSGICLDVFSDCYGGGSGTYCKIENFYQRTTIIKLLTKTIITTIQDNEEGCSAKTLLLAIPTEQEE